jgi:sensor histidine kinase YesM
MIKRYALGLVVCSVLGLFIFFFLFYTQTGIFPDQKFFIELTASIVTANFIGFILYKINIQLDKIISWRERASLRLLTGIISNYLITSVLGLSIIGALIVYRNEIEFIEIFSQFRESIVKAAIIVLCIILIYSVIHMTLFSYHEYSVVQIEKVKLERKQIALQFEALRNQLSPHYLFNCFNTISSLVYKDTELAETFIRGLAQTYQYVMMNNENQLVKVSGEIEFVKSYYYLMKVRFDNSIDLSIRISEAVSSTLIPLLTFQILVENAIKHNIFSKDAPLKIEINSINEKEILISNNILGQPKKVTSFKVGLENITRRYNFFTNRPIQIDKGSEEFKVILPVIETDFLKKKNVA